MSAYSYIFKFITVGESGVGKSCLLLQFSDRRFRADHDVTIGVEFGAKTISVEDKTLKIQVWDTVTCSQAGQENFLSVTRAYYRGSVAALLVYDVSSRLSFDSLSKWLDEIHNNAGEAVTVLLVANKADLAE
jgi:Ras-related protein Rab-2A